MEGAATVRHLQGVSAFTPVGNFETFARLGEGCPSISALQMSSRRKTFKATQIIVPLLPVPLGCWFLYKALKSFNRNPPPIATDSATVLQRPLYAEPVYQVCARLY